ncbi:MAG TPA: zinc transporter ZupT [Bacillota bacterium]|nr:zinc transporter ZupT [Bacillota bacterium]HPL54186.1 zinc transporter ZupT [Bacillota bacterium]
MNNNIVFLAFGLTLIAGISTGIGSLIAFFTKRTNARLLSGILGFSAGVMIYVSFMDILPYAGQILAASMGKKMGSWVALASFFGGILLIAVIDKLIPSFENPHEAKRVEQMDKDPFNIKVNGNLMKMGVLTAVAIGIHNFPEGIATFISALKDPNLGIAITVAIAIHNIPEGIAVSVPIFCATGDRKKALLYSFLSGLSEPLGALLGYLFLLPIMNDQVFGIMFALVAGIMVFISLDELLPTAIEYDEPHMATYGLIGGMAVMGISILLFI